MTPSLIQESRRHLEQLRQDAEQRATQEALLAASQQIAQRAALLFESDLAGPVAAPEAAAEAAEAPVDTTARHDDSWTALLSDLLSPAEGTPAPDPEPGHEVTTTTTVELDVPDELLGGPKATDPNGADPAALGAPATESPAEGHEDPVAPTVNTPVKDLTDAGNEELIDQVLDAPEDQQFDVVPETLPDPATQTPMEDNTQTAPENAARSFEDVLKEALGGDLEAPAPEEVTPEETAAPEELAPEAIAPEAIAPADDEAPAPEDTFAGAGEDDAEGSPANVDELAAALASLAAPAEEAAPEEIAPEASEDPLAQLNESTYSALQEEFAVLNEGVMLLAAKNKNQEAEIQQLKEALSLKTGQLTTVRGYLNEAMTMTAKTALANKLMLEHTTTSPEKKLIMESLNAATSRQEAEAVAQTLTEQLQKNSLLNEQKTAQHQVTRVFSSESGLLQESAHQAIAEEAVNPMVARWAANVNYKSK